MNLTIQSTISDQDAAKLETTWQALQRLWREYDERDRAMVKFCQPVQSTTKN